MANFGGFVLSGNTCSRKRKFGQSWRSVQSHGGEKFKAMKLPVLKAYLQNRGLIAVACAVEEMSLPLALFFQVSEAQDQLNLSRRLRVHDIQLPFKVLLQRIFGLSFF
jgi:hypothetical protein